MRILTPSLVAAGLALAAAPSAAQASPLDLYQEGFTSTAVQPAATRVVHDGSPYAEAFSPSPEVAVGFRTALATTSVPYTEAFVPSGAAVASPSAPSLLCACGHARG